MPKLNKLVIVEPHSDDAFLSLGWHLETVWKHLNKTIVTVFCDDKRANEAAKFADTVNSGHVSLNLEEHNMNSELSDNSPIEGLLETVSQLKPTQLIIPLGLQHPDHIRVRRTFTDDCYFYLDTPYQCKLKLQEDLLEAVKGLQIHSIQFPGARKWRHSSIFKTQSKFFHFNQDLKTSKLAEIVLCPH